MENCKYTVAVVLIRSVLTLLHAVAASAHWNALLRRDARKLASTAHCCKQCLKSVCVLQQNEKSDIEKLKKLEGC